MAIPADKWLLRPYDPKCKATVPHDSTVEDQIRCKVPLWSGDFDELKPELTAQGIRLDELRLLTVRDVGQYVIRAAQCGSLAAGPIGTAAHTIVRAGLADIPSSGGDILAPLRSTLDQKDWKLLAILREGRHVSKASKANRSKLASMYATSGKRYVGVSGNVIRPNCERLQRHGLIRGGRGNGTWILRQGLDALAAYEKEQGKPPYEPFA
jgi:hypothetical protein